MALFSRKKETPKENRSKAQPKEHAVLAGASRNLASVLIKPRITEKGVGASEKNVYTFLVHSRATKHDVRDAIKVAFNVTPVKVNIVNKTPRKSVSRRLGRTVAEKGMKKAYVYLKDGDSISIV